MHCKKSTVTVGESAKICVHFNLPFELPNYSVAYFTHFSDLYNWIFKEWYCKEKIKKYLWLLSNFIAVGLDQAIV